MFQDRPHKPHDVLTILRQRRILETSPGPFGKKCRSNGLYALAAEFLDNMPPEAIIEFLPRKASLNPSSRWVKSLFTIVRFGGLPVRETQLMTVRSS